MGFVLILVLLIILPIIVFVVLAFLGNGRDVTVNRSDNADHDKIIGGSNSDVYKR